MAYTKTTWVNGETPINADNLNNIEGGIKDNETLISNITGTILWKNPHPTDNFQAQTVELNSDDYDTIEITFLSFRNRGTYFTRKYYYSNGNGELDAVFNYNGKVFVGTRLFLFISKTKITFEVSYGTSLAENNSPHEDWIIPLQIVGYKTGLFGGSEW